VRVIRSRLGSAGSKKLVRISNENLSTGVGKMNTVSTTEAKSRFGSLLAEVNDGADAILIESHGRPRAVLVSAQQWITLNNARERVRRWEAWESLRQLAAEVSARNADLTQEEADSLADEIANEAMARVVAKARQRWEERKG